MDPLSDVLALLKPTSYRSGRFDVGGKLAVRFPKHEGIKCYAVLSGQCWLSVDGLAPLLLTEGDCFLLPRGLPFCLATDLSVEPTDFRVLLEALQSDAPLRLAGEGASVLAGGHFLLSGGPAGRLLEVLPPIVHLQKDSDKAAMRWSLDRLKEELRDPQPGGALIAQQLAYMMLVQALRLHLAEGARGGVGWLFALADKQMSAAITCIHDDPGRRWTLEELAARAGMSRSIFAQRFRQTVGSTPMEYLTRWRMLLAGDRLKGAVESISTIASSLGYESDSAFGKAFRRVMGCSPRQYSRGGGAAISSSSGDSASYNDQRELAAVG